jgi:hypothetical protein
MKHSLSDKGYHDLVSYLLYSLASERYQNANFKKYNWRCDQLSHIVKRMRYSEYANRK